MSYDLYFRSDRRVSVAELRKYFADQSHFTVSDERAHYENDATGVYFGFDFTSADADRKNRVPVAFNINYFRPHVFGLEAEPVVTAFIAAFGLGIDDPQSEGMGRGPYSPEGFLRGWNAGNRFGHRAVMTMEEAPTPLTLPSARVAGIWRWNFGKEQSSEAMIDHIDEVPPCFLPTVMLFQTGEREVKSLVIWDAQMAIAIPDVDLVLTTTDDGAPIVAPANDVLGIVGVHSTWQPDFEIAAGLPIGLTTRLVDEIGPRVTAQVHAAMRRFDPIARLSPDAVLDAELVAEARR
jgi:hypothetical protein